MPGGVAGVPLKIEAPYADSQIQPKHSESIEINAVYTGFATYMRRVN